MKKSNKTCLCGKCENHYTEEIEIDFKTWQKIEELRGDVCREKFVDEMIQTYLKNN